MKTVGINMLAIPPKMAGTGVYIYNLLSALITLDSDCRYVVFINKELVEKFPKSEKIEYRSFNVRNLIQRVFIEQVIIPLQSIRFTVLHAIANVAPLLSICPVITTIHDIYQLYYPERFPRLKLHYLKLFVPLSVWKSREVITVSECTKRDILKHYNSFSMSAKLVYIPEASRYEVRERAQQADKYLLFVGTLEPGKNLKTLLEAYAQLSIATKEEYPLRIVGGKGWKNSEIKDLVYSLQLQDCVEFMGYITDEELQELYYCATCFVLPSLYEGFGLPVLEAMSQGCPVITSNVSSLPEVAGDAAILVNPLDVQDIKHAIKTVIDNSSIQAELTQKGYVQVRTFSWERCARETLKLY